MEVRYENEGHGHPGKSRTADQSPALQPSAGPQGKPVQMPCWWLILGSEGVSPHRSGLLEGGTTPDRRFVVTPVH